MKSIALFQLASGVVFGCDQPLVLHLLDIAPMMGVLEGVVMELQDRSAGHGIN